MELNLNNFKSQTWVMLILVFAFAVCSSTLFIYIFDQELFFKTELIKLLLLSLSFSLPIWFLNSVFVDVSVSNDLDEEIVGISGSLLSFPVIYIPILIKFFWNISLQTGVIIALSLQLVIIIFFLIDFIKGKEKK